jgi:hypothetical protein
MTAEVDWRSPVLGFDPSADRVVLLADPPGGQLTVAEDRDS